ncbi:MAG: TolC family protein [Leptothrix sp. (in: Bacteria)]|nr:TolC family protein [Leptothrix sp. (in: b-proteobacteria)]
MRFRFLAAACVLAAAHALAGAQTPAASLAAVPLTLAEAMRLAEAASPAIRLREAQLAAAEGARREASTLLANNPELSLQRSDLRTRVNPAPDERSKGWAMGIAQPFEIGGQQSLRRQSAAAALEALDAEIDDARRQVRGEAALRFQAVLAAQRRIQIEQRSADLFDSTAQAIAKRRAAGEDTRLDANVALVEAERARNALGVAREQWLDARADLASALQLAPATLPEVSGDLAMTTGGPMPYALDQLVTSAQARSSLRAAAARETAARARLDLQRANRLPDVTVGLNVGRDGPGTARDRITTLTLSVPLPLFKRNQAGVGQALTDLATSQVERAALIREQEAQVRRLWLRLNSQRERVRRLQQALLPASLDNQQLAARSRQAGQIGLLDQLVINRQALDAERELNDALVEYHATRIELEIAAGWSLEGSAR